MNQGNIKRSRAKNEQEKTYAMEGTIDKQVKWRSYSLKILEDSRRLEEISSRLTNSIQNVFQGKTL